MREFTGCSDCCVGRILQLRIVNCKSCLTSFAFQSRNCYIFIMYIQVCDFLIAPYTERTNSCYIFFNQRLFERSTFICLERTIPDQAFVIQHIEEFCCFTKSFIHSSKLNFSINDSQMVSILITSTVRVSTSKCTCETIEQVVGSECISCTKPCSHWNFIIHTIAIQVSAVTESFQTINPLINSCRNVFSNFVQPCFVNHEWSRCQNQSIHFFYIRETISMSVRSCNFHLILWIFIQECFQVRHVICNQLFCRQEYFLVCILYCNITGFTITKVPEYVRKIISTGKQQVDLFLSTIKRNLLPVKCHTCSFFPLFASFKFCRLNNTVWRVYQQHGNLSVFFLKSFLIFDNRKSSIQLDDSGIHSFLFFRSQLGSTCSRTTI